MQQASFAVQLYCRTLPLQNVLKNITALPEVAADFYQLHLMCTRRLKILLKTKGLDKIVLVAVKFPGVTITPDSCKLCCLLVHAGRAISFTSDGSAAAAEICDGLRRCYHLCWCYRSYCWRNHYYHYHLCLWCWFMNWGLIASLSSANDAATEEWADTIPCCSRPK